MTIVDAIAQLTERRQMHLSNEGLDYVKPNGADVYISVEQRRKLASIAMQLVEYAMAVERLKVAEDGAI